MTKQFETKSITPLTHMDNLKTANVGDNTKQGHIKEKITRHQHDNLAENKTDCTVNFTKALSLTDMLT